jgi:DeoR/GlpR family transcriptional regulator of sugar metabolism
MPVAELCRRLSISEATARRDLITLTKERKITRTHGGSLGDFNDHFVSFQERQKRARKGKQIVAAAAYQELEPGQTVFFDAGTTLLALAERLASRPLSLRIVTNNLPVAGLLSSIPEIEVHLLGGRLLPRQSVLLGDNACATARQWHFTTAFLSAEGLDAEGLWNTQRDVVLFQRAVLACTDRTYLCLDRSKLGHRTDHFLAPLKDVHRLITDASSRDLQNAGVRLP